MRKLRYRWFTHGSRPASEPGLVEPGFHAQLEALYQAVLLCGHGGWGRGHLSSRGQWWGWEGHPQEDGAAAVPEWVGVRPLLDA